ncbi:MAG: hypothetical protein KF712_19570 [Akkermansiaceae bacterium]|nr:hypothetical protein [Akkermansiaceae bacterium]
MSHWKKYLPFLVYPALGLLVGRVSLRVAESRAEESSATGKSSGAPSQWKRDDRGRASAPVMTRPQLLEAIRRKLDAPAGSTGVPASIAGWTDAEIQAALDEAAAKPEAMLNDFNMATTLLRAYAEQNPEGALEWAIRQTAMQRGKFIPDVLRAWPDDKADEALAIVRKHRDVFGRNVPMSLVPKLVTAASADGPGAVVARLQEMMGDGFNRLTTFPDQVAPGFDYGGLLSSPEFQAMRLDGMKSSVLHCWMADDRDAAFQWALGTNGLGSLFQLRPPTWKTTPEKSAELTRWMAAKVEAMPPEQRNEFVRMNRDQFRQDGGDALVWIESVKAPELRDAIRTAAAEAVFSQMETYIDRGLQALGTLPDGESRIRAMEDLVKNREITPRFNPRSTEEDRLLRTRLAEWGADEARIDAIFRGIIEKEPEARVR